MIIKRYVQSCFSIKFEDLIIYFDPYKIPENADKADLIFITHGHPDHYDKKAIQNIIKDNTKIICPASCKKIIKAWNATEVSPNETISLKGLDITMVPMYNTKFLVKTFFHPKRKNYTGYLIGDGTIKIYHAGDTNLIPEMSNLGTVDIAFLPIGGFFTMNLVEAIEATALINPRFVIPMHELKQNLENFKIYIQEKLPNTKPIILTSENDIFEL